MPTFMNLRNLCTKAFAEKIKHTLTPLNIENTQNNMKELKPNIFLTSINVNKHIVKFS